MYWEYRTAGNSVSQNMVSFSEPNVPKRYTDFSSSTYVSLD